MFSFIILHYKNIDMTLNCIKSLSGFKNAKIIIVDNNTLNSEEEKELLDYNVDVLKLKQNAGFANANNKGIEFAEKKYKSKYYIVMNNDVIIKSNDFLEKIDDDYKKYNFDMLGPYIESPTGESVNPFPVISSKNEVEDEIDKCQRLIKIYSSGLLYGCLRIYLKIKQIFKKKRMAYNGADLKTMVPLHGCCIIFSKKYIKKYDYPFYNGTFLYHEEEFLYQRVLKDKVLSLYDPSLKIYHLEGASLKYSINNQRKRCLFREKERLKSLLLLIKEL